MKNIKQLAARLEELLRRAARKQRKCSYENCSESTAKNHCISQSFLRDLCADPYVRELNVSPWVEGKLQFSRKGIGEATIFHGLCAAHDHKLFHPVDQPEFGITYDNLLRLAYRSLLREKLNKTIKMEAYTALAAEYPASVNGMVSQAALKRELFKFNLLSVKWYEEALIAEMKAPAGTFIFRQAEFPFFEVAGSELFTYEPDQISIFKRHTHDRQRQLDPFAEIFVNLIPSKKQHKLIVTAGAHVKDVQALDQYMQELQKQSTPKTLSDILILQACDWVCSEKFYNHYLSTIIPEILSVYEKTSAAGVIHRRTSFSIFPE